MILFENVTKEFPNGTVALREVSFHLEDGEFAFFVGPSGAGKTTILRLILKDLEPTGGKITVGEQDLALLKKKLVPEYRRQIGAAFQDFKIIEDRTVRENVALVSEMVKPSLKEALTDVEEIIRTVGLGEKGDLFPSQLSGGELQRTTIARALAVKPKILFADEPTGNLDQATAWEILNLLLEINKQGTTVLVATHNHDFLSNLDKRVIELNQGRIIKDTKKPKPEKPPEKDSQAEAGKKKSDAKPKPEKPKPEEKPQLTPEKSPPGKTPAKTEGKTEGGEK